MTRISSPQFNLPPGMRAVAHTAGGLDVRSKKWLKHPSVCLRIFILKSFHVCLFFVISAEGDPNPCDAAPPPQVSAQSQCKVTLRGFGGTASVFGSVQVTVAVLLPCAQLTLLTDVSVIYSLIQHPLPAPHHHHRPPEME